MKRGQILKGVVHIFTETEDEENEELDSETLIEKQTILALFTDDKNDDYYLRQYPRRKL